MVCYASLRMKDRKECRKSALCLEELPIYLRYETLTHDNSLTRGTECDKRPCQVNRGFDNRSRSVQRKEGKIFL